jgi:hypothetical protein
MPSTRSVSGKPVVNAGPGKPQGLDNRFRAFAFLNSMDGTDAYFLQIPEECFNHFLAEWRKWCKNDADMNEMEIFMQNECSKWAK